MHIYINLYLDEIRVNITKFFLFLLILLTFNFTTYNAPCEIIVNNRIYIPLRVHIPSYADYCTIVAAIN